MLAFRMYANFSFISYSRFFVLRFMNNYHQIMGSTIMMKSTYSPFSPITSFLFNSRATSRIFTTIYFPISTIANRRSNVRARGASQTYLFDPRYRRNTWVTFIKRGMLSSNNAFKEFWSTDQVTSFIARETVRGAHRRLTTFYPKVFCASMGIARASALIINFSLCDANSSAIVVFRFRPSTTSTRAIRAFIFVFILIASFRNNVFLAVLRLSLSVDKCFRFTRFASSFVRNYHLLQG